MYRLFGPVRAAGVSAAVAHVLAWVAFLWIVLNPCAYRGVSATAIPVDGLDQGQSEVEHYCAYFIEFNGLWGLTAMFIPVILTGLALITLLTWKGAQAWNKIILGCLATVLLAFCVMGYLSYGIMYLPAALALITAAIILGVRTGAAKRQKQGE